MLMMSKFGVLGAASLLYLVNNAGADFTYSPPDCHFLSSQTNVTIAQAINKRCIQVINAKIIAKSGRKGVNVVNRKCGVTNDSSLAEAQSSEICWSQHDDVLATAFIHQIKITNELYYEDYKDVKKKRFQNMKTNIDELWNSQGIEHLLANGFERASVIEITSSSHNLEVHTLIQFRDEFESEAYQGKFYTQMIEESFFGRYIISSNSTISELFKCDNLSSIASRVPQDLWNASDGSALVEQDWSMGSTVDFSCPDDLMLNQDTDGFEKHDNHFSLLCTVLGRYDEPAEWPKCVPRCGELQDPPSHSLMNKVPLITWVPAGQFARFVCNDTTLGVERSSTEFLEVECQENREYNYPPNDTWPVCRTRTTTMSPVLPVAIRNQLERQRTDLEYRALVTGWTDGFEPTNGQDGFLAVALPYFIGLTILVLGCCCVTRKDSPIYRLCGESQEFQKLG